MVLNVGFNQMNYKCNSLFNVTTVLGRIHERAVVDYNFTISLVQSLFHKTKTFARGTSNSELGKKFYYLYTATADKDVIQSDSMY